MNFSSGGNTSNLLTGIKVLTYTDMCVILNSLFMNFFYLLFQDVAYE